MEDTHSLVDVLIVGAGPVGLITAFQLAKFGGVSVAIIEKYEKSVQDAYGRAITLFPRTSEMLDQLGLAEELAQQCFACRETVTYNSKGEEVQGRGWSFMETGMSDTAWDFALVLRQKYQEDVFRSALKKHDVEVMAPVELIGVEVDESIPILQHRVIATIKKGSADEVSQLACKYLIGCDGGHSSVRRMMNIPFHGTTSEDKWVRIDGMVETNLPKPRTYCAIESPTHGNVLWVGLDRGRTRIGYAFTDARAQSHERFDEAAAIEEAIAAVKPFDIEFKSVDWWTIYSVGQRVAESFFVKDCVFLAGDACHTHSSGAAQGMNTGIHDSVNLAWKLSLVLRGLAKVEILSTYQAERLPNVQKLIRYDRDISRLMTNRFPEGWTGDQNTDLNVLLSKIMAEAASFSSGLGIKYDDRQQSLLGMTNAPETPHISRVGAGERAPDVALLKPGTFERTRLITQTPSTAEFYCLLFSGVRKTDHVSYPAEKIQSSRLLTKLKSRGLLEFIHVLPDKAPSAFAVLGREPLGRVFFDQGERALNRYGIDENGGVVLIRPDGWIGMVGALHETIVSKLEEYFAGFIT